MTEAQEQMLKRQVVDMLNEWGSADADNDEMPSEFADRLIYFIRTRLKDIVEAEDAELRWKRVCAGIRNRPARVDHA